MVDHRPKTLRISVSIEGRDRPFLTVTFVSAIMFMKVFMSLPHRNVAHGFVLASFSQPQRDKHRAWGLLLAQYVLASGAEVLTSIAAAWHCDQVAS